MKKYKIEFPGTQFAPVELEEGAPLVTELTPENSPVFFGCRTGLCATCLIEVLHGGDKIPPPSEDEKETLEIYAEGNPNARLTCQLKLTADLAIKKINPK